MLGDIRILDVRLVLIAFMLCASCSSCAVQKIQHEGDYLDITTRCVKDLLIKKNDNCHIRNVVVVFSDSLFDISEIFNSIKDLPQAEEVVKEYDQFNCGCEDCLEVSSDSIVVHAYISSLSINASENYEYWMASFFVKKDANKCFIRDMGYVEIVFVRLLDTNKIYYWVSE